MFTKFIKWIFGSRNTTTTTTTPKDTNGVKWAICAGINDYPGTNNDLRGCVNDAKAWSDELNRRGFTQIVTLLNNQVTKANIIRNLKNIISKCKDDDVIVFTFSGHGTFVPDRDGDEPDGKDEALCCYDVYLIDDEIRSLLNTLPKTVKFIFISDSCHSGTVSRSYMASIPRDQDHLVPRYLPPEDDKIAESISLMKVHSKFLYTESDMNHILLTGCKDSEYSYDAFFGKSMGAMTYHATQILKANKNITYRKFHEELRKALPSNKYPQTPQLEGPDSLKDSLMF